MSAACERQQGRIPTTADCVRAPILTLEDVARVCHEADRALCTAFGMPDPLSWQECPVGQRAAALGDVKEVLRHPHRRMPCPHLPETERIREELFLTICRTLLFPPDGEEDEL